MEELQGIAEGAGVEFDDLAVLNAMEAVSMDALHLTKCTSMAVNEERTADGHVLIAHNEDWLPEDEADVYVLHARPKDEPPFLAMTYGGLLPNIGFNAAGIAQCCDSVYPNDSRIGIPRVIVSRAVLSASTPGEAIGHVLVTHGQPVITTSWPTKAEAQRRSLGARFAILSSEDGFVVHTNHYLTRRCKLSKANPMSRLERASAISASSVF
jgi:isopenicillin-N N-acyltransferase-like protein